MRTKPPDSAVPNLCRASLCYMHPKLLIQDAMRHRDGTRVGTNPDKPAECATPCRRVSGTYPVAVPHAHIITPALSLTSGTRLGPYEVVSAIGAGGMGEVYRAKDTRLERIVALKVLAPRFAADQQFRERFEREAKTLSHLNHPHVCTLYDVGHAADTAFLVMEYLDGETLAARLANRSGLEEGGLPLNDAIKIAIEIASALDAAHRLGITHRDLKPSNVMLTKAGAKLVDFGLAKGRAGSSVQADNPALPTRSAPSPGHDAPLTEKGTILGTFQYMAPEQIEGQDADTRTDMFAFGALVHEMVTGRRAFQGKTQASLIGSILKDDPPPISSIRKVSPPALDFVIRKCLAKDPDDRWQSARDVVSQLEWIGQGSGAQVGTPAAKSWIATARLRERLAWAVAGVLAVLLAITVGTNVDLAPPAEERDVRFEIPAPEASPFALTISPNGRLVAFVARAPDTNRNLLWLRPLAATVAQPLAGTDGASAPFWSSDSRSIGFVADGSVKRVDAAGGLPRTVCDVPPPHEFSGTWHDNTIVFSSGLVLLRVAAEGGQPAVITTLDLSRGETAYRYPTFLPDGRHLVYSVQSTDPANTGVFARSLDSPDRTRVLEAVSMVAYAEPGYLIYQDSGALMAQPFDATRLRLNGTPTRIAERITLNPNLGLAAFAVSESGALVYRTAGARESSQLQWFDRTGKPLERLGQPGFFRGLALSPDEKRVAVSRPDPETGKSDVWTIELSTGVPTRVTFDPASTTMRHGPPMGWRSASGLTVAGTTASTRGRLGVPGMSSCMNRPIRFTWATGHGMGSGSCTQRSRDLRVTEARAASTSSPHRIQVPQGRTALLARRTVGRVQLQRKRCA